MSRLLPILLAGALQLPVNAQKAAPIRLSLLDGEDVFLYERYPRDQGRTLMLYAPFNLRIAERDGDPQFTFLAYRRDDADEIQGGILHLLLTWGPTKDQERELSKQLQMRTDSTHLVAGALSMDPHPHYPGLEIGPEDHPLAQALRRSMNAHGIPPLSPGSKMAASFHLSAEDARAVADALDQPRKWGPVYLRVHLQTFGRNYYPQPPAYFTLTQRIAACIPSE